MLFFLVIIMEYVITVLHPDSDPVHARIWQALQLSKAEDYSVAWVVTRITAMHIFHVGTLLATETLHSLRITDRVIIIKEWKVGEKDMATDEVLDSVLRRVESYASEHQSGINMQRELWAKTDIFSAWTHRAEDHGLSLVVNLIKGSADAADAAGVRDKGKGPAVIETVKGDLSDRSDPDERDDALTLLSPPTDIQVCETDE